MSLIGFLILLFVASLCGSIGASLAGRSSQGCLTNIALGFIGAVIGSWLSREAGIPDILYLKNIPILWSIVGSAIFIAILSMFTGNRDSRK